MLAHNDDGGSLPDDPLADAVDEVVEEIMRQTARSRPWHAQATADALAEALEAIRSSERRGIVKEKPVKSDPPKPTELPDPPTSAT